MARQQIEKAKAEQRAATRKGNKEISTGAANAREGLRKKVKVGVEEKDATGIVNGKRKRLSEAGKGDKRVKMEDGVDEDQ